MNVTEILVPSDQSARAKASKLIVGDVALEEDANFAAAFASMAEDALPDVPIVKGDVPAEETLAAPIISEDSLLQAPFAEELIQETPTAEIAQKIPVEQALPIDIVPTPQAFAEDQALPMQAIDQPVEPTVATPVPKGDVPMVQAAVAVAQPPSQNIQRVANAIEIATPAAVTTSGTAVANTAKIAPVVVPAVATATAAISVPLPKQQTGAATLPETKNSIAIKSDAPIERQIVQPQAPTATPVPTVTPTTAKPPTQQVNFQIPLGEMMQAMPEADADLHLPLSQIASRTETTPLSPVALAKLTSPAQATALVNSIAANVSKMANGAVEIRLDPPELGRVAMNIVGRDGDVVALITAERPEVLDLMRKNQSTFARYLENAGFAGISMSFQDFNQREDTKQDQSNSTQDTHALSEFANDVANTQMLLGETGRIDIRL